MNKFSMASWFIQEIEELGLYFYVILDLVQ